VSGGPRGAAPLGRTGRLWVAGKRVAATGDAAGKSVRGGLGVWYLTFTLGQAACSRGRADRPALEETLWT
jgi:hypothetical protein